MQRCRELFPSFFSVAETAVGNVAPTGFEKFLCLICNISDYLALFILQYPTSEQLSNCCDQLPNPVRAVCQNVDVDNLRMQEMASLLKRSTTTDEKLTRRHYTTRLYCCLSILEKLGFARLYTTTVT